jgi:cysteine-rich repeat protein
MRRPLPARGVRRSAARRSGVAGPLRAFAAAACLAAAACGQREAPFEVVVWPDPPDLAGERIRIELTFAAGTGVWERTWRGVDWVPIDTDAPWAGTARAWLLLGSIEEPTVVGYGEAVGEPGSRRVDIDVRPAEDTDGDWIVDEADVCPAEPNPRQVDGDGDTRGDSCDVCPDAFDPEQTDSDGDGIGDACDDPPRCGDGATQGAEQCDDGNDERGDGCAPDCLREECGNGRIDPGEACDDGDADDGDGCSTGCVHAPGTVAVDGVLHQVPRAAPARGGRLVVAWVAWPVGAPLDGELGYFLALGEAAGDALGDPVGVWPGHAVNLLHVQSDPARDVLQVLWADEVSDAREQRLFAAEVPVSLLGIEAPGIVDVFDGLEFHAWGSWSDEARAAVVFPPGSASWIDLSSWPPEVAEEATTGSYGNCFVAGAHRAGGGWILAWRGRRDDAPDGHFAAWARRYDETRVPVDPDDVLLVDTGREPISNPLAIPVHDPAADVYVVVVTEAGEVIRETVWHVLEPGGGAARSSVGAPLPWNAALTPHDGGVVALWFRQDSTRCQLHAQRLDGAGAASGDARHTFLADEPGLSACEGRVSELADGRALVLWAHAVGEGVGETWTIGWRLFASLDELLPS